MQTIMEQVRGGQGLDGLVREKVDGEFIQRHQAGEQVQRQAAREQPPFPPGCVRIKLFGLYFL